MNMFYMQLYYTNYILVMQMEILINIISGKVIVINL